MGYGMIKTPGGLGTVSDKSLVGKNFTGNLAGFNGKLFVIDLENLPDPMNPLNLPQNTIRVKFSSGYTPPSDLGDSQVLVDSTNNIWDIYKSNKNWNHLFSNNSYLIEVLGGNTKYVTNMSFMFYSCTALTTVNIFSMENVTFAQSDQNFAMFDECSSLVSVPKFIFPKLTNISQMFHGCTALTTVPLFETAHVISTYNMFSGCSSLIESPLFNMANVTNCNYMFNFCTSLTRVPLFDLSSANITNYMFNNCTKVEYGALSLYRQVSTQSNPPSEHSGMFNNCGYNTQSGRADLQQIPQSWGGMLE